MSDLTRDQWEYIEPHLRGSASAAEWQQRAQWERAILNGVLWRLRTDGAWSEMPARYPHFTTCWRRYRKWTRSGTLATIIRALGEHLSESCELEVSRADPELAAILHNRNGSRCWVYQTLRLYQSPGAQKVMRERGR